MHRSSAILAQLKIKHPQQDFHAIDFTFFVEIRTTLQSEFFKNGSEDVAFTVDHDKKTVRLNADNPYKLLADIDEVFKPADQAYSQLARELLGEILEITGYSREAN